MGKCFNTTGLCFPEEHYMVNIDGRLDIIAGMVKAGKYFTINRARQYGKTTTINLLTEKLSGDYVVFSISLEGIEEEAYRKSSSFCQRIYRLLYNSLLYTTKAGVPDFFKEQLGQMRQEERDLADLSDFISGLCGKAEKPVLLIVDEVDQASGEKIFLSFLGMLRNKYLDRKKQPTFWSVILAGVHDIKNLKLGIRPEAERQYNSPWNVAAEFTVDMSFSIEDIAGMLREYEADHNTGMEIFPIATYIYEYTSGYPFLVSRLCQIMDERPFGAEWTVDGLTGAVKALLSESNTLFDDMVKKLNDFPGLKQVLHSILFKGEKITYNSYNSLLNIGIMFGFMKEVQNNVVVSNRIFETVLYNLFISEELLDSRIYKAALLDGNIFIKDGRLDMELVLKKFAEAFTEIYGGAEDSFLEENGRRFFLLYLKPIINGTGNYYVEARTRNMRRTDVVIDYRGEQYVCELKIWRGNEYNERGKEQLADYLDAYRLDTGYMISFNFNKNKKTGIRKTRFGGKTIIEAVI